MSTPVFVGGVGRSGTTLVADLLGLHPDLSPIYETDFLIAVSKALLQDTAVSATELLRFVHGWGSSLPQRPHNKRAHERYVHGPHYLLFTQRELMTATQELISVASLATDKAQLQCALRGYAMRLFGAHTARDNKLRWVNKTPAYVRSLPMLLGIFPQMRFVHCVRDGRDVATSVMSRPWGPNTVPAAARWWSGIVDDAQAFSAQHPERVFMVRYEHVVADPASAIGEVLDWLGEDQRRELLRGRIGAMEPNRSGGWRTQLNTQEQQTFAQLAGPQLNRLGYLGSALSG